jgi:Fur family ferric uptake transcriptional regulator
MKIQTIIERLREHGYKLTPQRRAIVEIIANRHEHLTPAAIYESVHDEYPTVGLVTVYRTLDVLTDLGLLCRVHTEDGCQSYLMRRRTGHHHHIVCSSCGTVADFTRCDIETMERKISRQTGFKIQGHLLEFEGLCSRCAKAAARPGSPM